MSYRYFAPAIEKHLGLGPTAKYVLIVLADGATVAGTSFPSVRWLAARTELSPRAVRKAMADLTKAGMLERRPRKRANGTLTSNMIRLILPGVEPVTDDADPPAPSANPTAPAAVPPTAPAAGQDPKAGVRSETEDPKAQKTGYLRTRAEQAPPPVSSPKPPGLETRRPRKRVIAEYRRLYQELHPEAEGPPSVNGRDAKAIDRLLAGGQSLEKIVSTLPAFLQQSEGFAAGLGWPLWALEGDWNRLAMGITRPWIEGRKVARAGGTDRGTEGQSLAAAEVRGVGGADGSSPSPPRKNYRDMASFKEPPKKNYRDLRPAGGGA